MTTEDKGSVPDEKKIGVPKRKRRKSLARFFKVYATPLTILISAIGLLWGVYQFKAQQSDGAHMQATQVAASAHMQATQVAASAAQTLDQQRQATLDGYLKDMSDLLLKENLKTNSDAQALAQAMTYTAVRNLDGNRKGTLIRFLWGAKLINGPQPIIDLKSADLSEALLSNALLAAINLNHTNLHFAVFSSSVLAGADLRGACLVGADLRGADLRGADLRGADLEGANLHGDCLLGSASATDLRGADLRGADLRGALITNEQLLQAGHP